MAKNDKPQNEATPEVDNSDDDLPAITHPKKRAFLAAFAETSLITKAAEAAGIQARRVYEWRENDPVFAHAFEVARRKVGDMLCAHAIQLARKGVERYVLYQGKTVPHPVTGEPLKETDFPQPLLIFLLKVYGLDERGMRSSKTREAETDGTAPISQEDMLGVAIKSMLGTNDVPEAADDGSQADQPQE